MRSCIKKILGLTLAVTLVTNFPRPGYGAGTDPLLDYAAQEPKSFGLLRSQVADIAMSAASYTAPFFIGPLTKWLATHFPESRLAQTLFRGASLLKGGAVAKVALGGSVFVYAVGSAAAPGLAIRELTAELEERNDLRNQYYFRRLWTLLSSNPVQTVQQFQKLMSESESLFRAKCKRLADFYKDYGLPKCDTWDLSRYYLNEAAGTEIVERGDKSERYAVWKISVDHVLLSFMSFDEARVRLVVDMLRAAMNFRPISLRYSALTHAKWKELEALSNRWVLPKGEYQIKSDYFPVIKNWDLIERSQHDVLMEALPEVTDSAGIAQALDSLKCRGRYDGDLDEAGFELPMRAPTPDRMINRIRNLTTIKACQQIDPRLQIEKLKGPVGRRFDSLLLDWEQKERQESGKVSALGGFTVNSDKKQVTFRYGVIHQKRRPSELVPLALVEKFEPWIKRAIENPTPGHTYDMAPLQAAIDKITNKVLAANASKLEAQGKIRDRVLYGSATATVVAETLLLLKFPALVATMPRSVGIGALSMVVTWAGSAMFPTQYLIESLKQDRVSLSTFEQVLRTLVAEAEASPNPTDFERAVADLNQRILVDSEKNLAIQ